jgi:hypothetical protein
VRSIKWAACAAVIAFAIAGCSSSDPGPDKTGARSSAPKADDKPSALTAEQVSDQLAKAIPSFKTFRVYTEADDPNKLMGRPGGYISKTAFYDSRISKDAAPGERDDAIIRGGSVEVFESAELAAKRYEYVKTIAESSSLFTEYDYVAGTALVRVSKELTPSQAREYEAALKEIVG